MMKEQRRDKSWRIMHVMGRKLVVLFKLLEDDDVEMQRSSAIVVMKL